MSGIQSTTGLFSGIDSGKIIEQLIALESRPKLLAQRRLQQLQIQQAAYLDINAKLGSIRSASSDMRLKGLFKGTTSTTSDKDILTATTSNSAAVGSYQFIVDRLVSTQQMLSRGFSDKDASSLGASKFTFESAKARLDRDVSLSDLNGGDGIQRGKIVVTDSANNTTTVDLSKAATVNDVLDAINGNGVAKVKASVQDGKFVITDDAGGRVTVADASGGATAASLGIAGSQAGSITGANVYGVGATTTLAALNDGNGVAIKSSFGGTPSLKITVGSEIVEVNLGETYETVDGTQKLKEGAVSTVGGALKRINDALAAKGLTTVSASVAADGTRLAITDSAGGTSIKVEETNSTTAADLGLLGETDNGTLTGKKILAGLNSTLARSINGGKGIAGDGKLKFTTHDGTEFNVDLDALGVRDGSIDQIARAIETASGSLFSGDPRVTVTVNSTGTGLTITDHSTGASKLIISGPTDDTTAKSLGIATGAAGVTAQAFDGSNVQHQYVGRATLVSELNGGKGIGTGKFKITDSKGNTATVDIGDDTKTVGDLIDEINSRGLKVQAEINANGDGIVIKEHLASGEGAGATKIKITDESGAVAKALNLAGEAKAVGAENLLNGSYEKVVTLDAGDTLQKIADKINAAGVGVSANIIKDGSGSQPYRLNLSSQSTGIAGRFLVDTAGLDLGVRTLDAGNDARVFYGSSDAAKAILLTSSSNTLDNVISGVKIDLHGVTQKDQPVTLNVTKDNDGIVDAVKGFVAAFNAAVDRIDKQSNYDKDSQKAGPLLGDGTTQTLRQALYSIVQSPAKGISGQYDRLAEVGVKIGKGGVLELDESKLREAMAADAAGVEQLFVAYTKEDDEFIDLGDGVKVKNPDGGKTYKSLGVIGAVENLMTKYLDSVDGVLTGRKKTLDDQIDAQNKRIADFDVRLESRRGILERQFASMESAIANLQRQQGALSQLGG